MRSYLAREPDAVREHTLIFILGIRQVAMLDNRRRRRVRACESQRTARSRRQARHFERPVPARRSCAVASADRIYVQIKRLRASRGSRLRNRLLLGHPMLARKRGHHLFELARPRVAQRDPRMVLQIAPD